MRPIAPFTVGATLILLLIAAPIAAAQFPERTLATPVAAAGDVAGLVDIGEGRSLYIECRGSGGPTVILEAGAGNNGQIWDAIGLLPDTTSTAVLPGVAGFTRVCAYDRPGTMIDLDHRSRSDPGPMPTTAAGMVADLHALLTAAAVPGPYVFAGHSFGGLVSRLYASTYPDDIVGLVLVDAAHEDYYAAIQAILTPEQWSAFLAPPPEYADYDALERIDIDASAERMRNAAATSPLQPMPLVVLTHGVPWDWPAGYPADAIEAAWRPLQDELASLVPDARLIVAEQSQHHIQINEPELVIDAIRQVVEAVREPRSWSVSTPSASSGEVAGLVDIGGRSLWRECRGQVGPTVILVAGYRDRGDPWSTDLLHPNSGRTMVLPGVTAFTRVCTYERPGTALDENTFSRSDPVNQPQTAADAVADLHALLMAAAIPGPYVLVGHSYGGLVVRLYASTYPNEVVGLVLVDALPAVEKWLTPEQWAAYQQLLNQQPAGIADYRDLETIDLAASAAQMREAAAAAPLRSLPLIVLTRVRPFDLPPDLPPDFSADALERAWAAGQAELAALVPGARHVVATASGHGIQQDQPGLVIEAIRQVVEAVRDPNSWAVATPVASSSDVAG